MQKLSKRHVGETRWRDTLERYSKQVEVSAYHHKCLPEANFWLDIDRFDGSVSRLLVIHRSRI